MPARKAIAARQAVSEKLDVLSCFPGQCLAGTIMGRPRLLAQHNAVGALLQSPQVELELERIRDLKSLRNEEQIGQKLECGINEHPCERD
jgi:hypothetical protein